VHNLFIAIIERSFSSLKVVPPVQGNEPSDDEDEETNGSLKRAQTLKELKSKQ
jgi:hypothetical protein